jgi:sRNA-binding regulator protein Hfq
MAHTAVLLVLQKKKKEDLIRKHIISTHSFINKLMYREAIGTISMTTRRVWINKVENKNAD